MTPLHQILLDRLHSVTQLTFAEVMELALYHPEHGYYGPGPRRIGRSGDFYTSVSVGPLYGQLLATLATETCADLRQPSYFCVIEQAAHDGQLAEDVLSSCEFDYIIVEPNPRYEAVQREKLTSFGQRVRWVPSLADAPARPSLFICNELPDAMPVHLIRWDGSAWKELWVQADGEKGLHFQSGPISTEALAAEISRLPQDLPAGYTTEVGLAALGWMRDLANAPFHGKIYIADYGFDHEELYSPERHTGTIRRYHDHKTDDHILEDLGACDLTTHVNFTRLSEVGTAAGLKQQTYSHQGRYLGKLGLPWLATLEGRPPDAATRALLRQYHSLTHPAFMGRSFRVLILEKEKTP
ncbi:MAG: SAM-dependent methyltransferase [Verrucomicrobia bacterium]|nr:SAM-dependent methyltransferase [Verrucomicrobiota bacterium]